MSVPAHTDIHDRSTHCNVGCMAPFHKLNAIRQRQTGNDFASLDITICVGTAHATFTTPTNAVSKVSSVHFRMGYDRNVINSTQHC